MSQLHLLHPWTGEFCDERQELEYREHVQASTVRLLRTSLTVVALLFLAFALVDFHMVDDSSTLGMLLGIRLLFAVSCLALVALLGRMPALVDSPYPLNAILLLLVISSILIVPLRPETVETQLSAIITETLTLYLFIPNRIPWMVGQSILLAIGFVAGIIWAINPPLERVLVLLLVLTLPNIIGLMTALRLNKLQRLQFHSLATERKSNKRLTEEIEQRERLEAELRRLAQMDDLTGLNNRRWFMELAEQELRHSQRTGTPLTICMIDLDHFKAVNDTHGHAIGDHALEILSRLCKDELRKMDIMGRFGGEEFVVALPNATPQDAGFVAERIRKRIAGYRFTGELAGLTLTVTIGIAGVEPGEKNLDAALLRADKALYDGKHAGRDRVMVS
jgi:diguanylate cyclase (GGDEF)-like protein